MPHSTRPFSFQVCSCTLSLISSQQQDCLHGLGAPYSASEQPVSDRIGLANSRLLLGPLQGCIMLLPPLWRRPLSCAAPEGSGKGANGRHVKAVPEEARVQGSLEGCVGAALTVALPPLLYLVAHRHVIAQSQHLWGLLLLASAPLVLLTVLQVWSFPHSGPAC